MKVLYSRLLNKHKYISTQLVERFSKTTNKNFGIFFFTFIFLFWGIGGEIVVMHMRSYNLVIVLQEVVHVT